MKKYIWIAALALICLGCSEKEKFYPSILPDTVGPKTEIDEWLSENFGKYNIAVLYKWTDFHTNQEYTLVPADESTVVPCMTVIQRVWMKPYLEQGGESFFKTTSPKQVMLIGSEVYLPDGNKLVAEADQGNRVSIYNMNHQNPKDSLVVDGITQTFHHEYIHILHQMVRYPSTYESLCEGKYSSGWTGYTVNEAQDLGFITPYAMESANEDFAEMISNYIMLKPSAWDAYLTNTQGRSSEGYRILKEKEAMIIQYMLNTWGIDLATLRDSVQAELKKIIEEYKQEQKP